MKKLAPLALAAIALSLTACTSSQSAPQTPPPAPQAQPAQPMPQTDPMHSHPAPEQQKPEVLRLTSGKPARNQCNARAVQNLVGQPYGGPAMLEQAMTAAGADEVRKLRFDEMRTKEQKMGRLTLEVDAQGKVSSVSCS